MAPNIANAKFRLKMAINRLTKVIAMSGKLTDGQAQHLMHNGFDGYLKKPFHVRQVVETVEDAVAIVY